ncbi:Na(+)-translocating NADH-quinone reductase subunit F [Yeosuana marina]|uniref:Na(+)-translocating NADH-quinone reductase subunit F n=1 Tax=Yeosuana marina TaxID=1565536 RepID=UPI0030EB2772|tara:strand:- start:60 stop:515 length:456 start_codon:yes stop_codon:yes gene_type:complete
MRNANRIDAALKKLYVAFHENQLHPECCKQCAVGNILDNTDSWKHLSDHHGSVELNYIGNVHQSIGRKFNGYSPLELLKIEATFLKACGYKLPLHHKNKKPENPTDKEVLFNGLCAVVKFLCELDNIPDALEDYTKLFEYEEQKKELVAVA